MGVLSRCRGVVVPFVSDPADTIFILRPFTLLHSFKCESSRVSSSDPFFVCFFMLPLGSLRVRGIFILFLISIEFGFADDTVVLVIWNISGFYYGLV